MSDLTLRQQADGGFDIELTDDGLDLNTEKGLETAVILSVYLNRRAAKDDTLPDNSGDRRGSWQDDFQTPPTHHLGSRLWLLSREKTLPQVLDAVRKYLFEALQWLKDDGIADAVDINVRWEASDVLAFTVTIDGAPSGRYQRTFQQTLESL